MCTCWSARRSLHPETVCWLLSRSLGTCSSSASFAKVKISCVFTRVPGEEYFTLHGTRDTQNYDLFITLWSRRCGWELSASRLLLDVDLQTVRTLLLRLSVCLWSHCHLICIITNKNRSWSLMLLSLVLHDAADFDWWYIRYAAFPHWCAVLTQTKLATQEHVHALRAWNQLTHSFSNPSFSVPTWTVSLLLWDKLFFKVINNKIQSTGLQPAKWITSVAAKKPVGRAACMLSKKFY